MNSDIFYLLLFSSLHEMGHLITLLAFGYKPSEINISFYGIGLKHNADLLVYEEIIFLLAGVIINFGFAIFGIYEKINLALLIINIIPVYPLDGGRLLYLIVEKISFDKAYYICLTISFLIIIGLFIYSIILCQYNLLFIDLYLLSFFIKEVFYDKKRS